jgi:hypothetical protein
MVDSMELIGVKVQISMSDPWEVLDCWTPDKLIGAIIRCESTKISEEVTIHLLQSLSHNQQNYQYVIASPRYDDDFSKFRSGQNMACDLLFVPIDRDIQSYRTEDWRGRIDGLGGIGVLKNL